MHIENTFCGRGGNVRDCPDDPIEDRRTARYNGVVVNRVYGRQNNINTIVSETATPVSDDVTTVFLGAVIIYCIERAAAGYKFMLDRPTTLGRVNRF